MGRVERPPALRLLTQEQNQKTSACHISNTWGNQACIHTKGGAGKAL